METKTKLIDKLLACQAKPGGVLFGLLFALAVMTVVVLALFWGGVIGGVDYGEYNTTLSDVGLARTDDDLANESRRYYVDVSDTFKYAPFSYEALLGQGKSSLVYPVMAVRLVTQPFGLTFHTEALAVVYGLILALSMFLMAKALFRRYGGVAAAPCILGLFILCVPELVGFLNSLQWQGTAFVGLYGFVCVLVWALLSPLRGRLTRFVVLSFYGVLLCGAHAAMLVFLPLVLLSSLWILLRDRPEKPRMAGYFILGGLMLVWCTQHNVSASTASPDYASTMSRYQAAFDGSLQYAQDRSSALAEYGLDDTYLSDIGHSYYQAGADFAHDPKQTDEWSKLEGKLNAGATLTYYIKNPSAMAALLRDKDSTLQTVQNGRVAVKGTGDRQACLNPLTLLGVFLPAFGRTAFFVMSAIGALLSALFLVFGRSRSRVVPLSLVLLLLVTAALYLPWSAAIGGAPMIDVAKPVYFAAALMLGAGLLSCVLRGVAFLNISHDETKPRYAVSEGPIQLPGLGQSRLGRGLAWLTGSGMRLTCVALILSIGMLLVLLCLPPRAGGVNNGDFGRMMKELDITWTDQLNTDYANQAGRYVIEDYNYRNGFNPLKLTAAQPTYSLIFPTALVRLYSALTGHLFSTRLIQYIYCVITLICILSIVYHIYPVFKRYTVIPAVLLPLMCFGENYIAWYNSLFGESSISVGLLMTLALSVHLAVRERGKRPLLLLVLLAFAINFLVCAKAQMVVALPVGVGLLLFFFIYHRPRRSHLLYKIFYGLIPIALAGYITLSGIGIYKNNDNVSSRQTVWQSVFFGALMISDDVDAAMKELNIPAEMKADIGKHAYYPDEDYVYAPMSQKAQDVFYSRVNTLTMVKYYLHHPKDLLYMLNHATGEAVKLHTGFMAYVGERYDQEHTPVSRMSLWSQLRTYIAPRAFWEYVLLYGGSFVLMVVLLRRHTVSARAKALVAVWMALMMVGVLQYPLTVIGNGFADNNKQLYGFMLCHDLLMVTLATYIVLTLTQRGKNTSIKIEEPVMVPAPAVCTVPASISTETDDESSSQVALQDMPTVICENLTAVTSQAQSQHGPTRVIVKRTRK